MNALGSTLRVALGEYDIGWHDPATSLERAARITESSARAGARLVVLPEMCTSGFTMDVELAEQINGDNVGALARMAVRSSVWLLAGVATRDADSEDSPARNSALLFSPSGSLAAKYDKQRLFAYANEQESYAAGNTPVVVDVDGVRVSPFICYDLRFPELFRTVAAQADLMVVIASWPAARRTHWDTLLRARAIENQCYVIGVNRTGTGGSISYDGGSAAYDPWGDSPITMPVPGSDGTTSVLVAADEVGRVRAAYPFLVDAINEGPPAASILVSAETLAR